MTQTDPGAPTVPALDPPALDPSPDNPVAAPGQPRQRWCWGTRVLVTVATAWLGFVGLHYALSGRWWAWELIELLPPPLFLVFPLLGLLGLALLRPFRRLPTRPNWWVVATLVVALGLGGSMAGFNLHALRGDQTTAPPADALRVVAWNAEHWDQEVANPEDLYAYLREQDADVYLLQEYLHRGERSPLEIDDTERLSAEFPGYEMVSIGGLLTMSRFPIVSWDPISVSEADAFQASDWSDYWLTKVMRTDVQLGTEVVSFYNLHVPTPVNFRYSPRSMEFYQYTREAHPWRKAVVGAMADDVADNCHPILVAGDFNATSLRPSMHRVDSRLTDAIRYSGSLYPGTWALDEVELRLWRLDYAYTTPEFQVHEYTFLDPEGLSDHKAQRLVVSLDDSVEPAASCAGAGQ